MKSYERNRILVDQCTGCGGLFLDRGELEQLAAAENAWHGGNEAPAARVQDRDRDNRRDEPRYDNRRDEPRYDSRGESSHRPRKKKSFLSELFED
jgi:Zn-finger nucleic acid-binding protein